MPHRLRVTTLIVGMTLLLVQLDATVLGTAIPTIARDLNLNPLKLHLTISLYQLTLAVFIPISGWAADRFGSKRLFLYAVLLFVSMSIACALATSLTHLLIARSVQGFAGAFLMPIGRLTVIRMAGSKNLVEAMVWVVTPAAFGIAFGPFLGGVIVHYLSWRWIFLMNVPVCIAVGLLASVYFRSYVRKSKVPFDVIGFLLLGGCASLLLSGIANLSHSLDQPYLPAGLFTLSILCGCGFVWHARRCQNPVINLKLFENSSFSISTFAGVPLRVGVSSFAFVMPLILQIPMGLSSLTTGLLMGAAAVGALLSRTIAHKLIVGLGFRGVILPCTIALSVLTLAVGFIWLTQSLIAVFILILLTGFTRSLQFTSANTACYADLPKCLINQGVSFAGLVQQLSISLAVGFAAAILNIRQDATEETMLTGPDFIWLSILTGLFTISPILFYWRLPRGLGRKRVSGQAQLHE